MKRFALSPHSFQSKKKRRAMQTTYDGVVTKKDEKEIHCKQKDINLKLTATKQI
uniref:Uncharacterized protein n=1 Tax=Arundo donax TaxID=35708 RepID=A0A0A9BR79_ARUDO